MMPGEKAKDFRGSVGKLLNYMGRYKIALVFVIIFAICSTAFNIVGPKILKQSNDRDFQRPFIETFRRCGNRFRENRPDSSYINRNLWCQRLFLIYSGLADDGNIPEDVFPNEEGDFRKNQSDAAGIL